jgi:hypothetical protein
VFFRSRRKNERHYSYSLFGSEIIYRYNNLVLAELDDDDLLGSENPIDLALYSAKCAARSKDDLQKFNYLRSISGLLAKRGWDAFEKRDLLLFIERS